MFTLQKLSSILVCSLEILPKMHSKIFINKASFLPHKIEQLCGQEIPFPDLNLLIKVPFIYSITNSTPHHFTYSLKFYLMEFL